MSFNNSPIVVNYQDYIESKLEIKTVKQKVNGVDSEVDKILYDNRPFILQVGPRATDDKNDPDNYKIYTAYGVQKEFKYDAVKKQYTNEPTGEYSVTFKMYDKAESPVVCEKKLMEVLVSIRETCNRFLAKKFPEDPEDPDTKAPKVGDLISYSYVKVDGKKTKRKDPTKSPMLKVKCLSAYPKGMKYEDVKPEHKTLGSKFFDMKNAPKDVSDCIVEGIADRKITKCVPLISFNKIHNPNKDWYIHYRLKEANIKLLPAMDTTLTTQRGVRNDYLDDDDFAVSDE